MSSERSASAITSLPKPGALAPAGVGRSRPATAGSAALVLARAVADWDGVMAGISSAVGALGQVGPHPTGSRALTQPGEKSHAGIAVGRRHAGFALKILRREHGVVAETAVGAAGVVAERGEAALDLLDFGERGSRFAAREFLHERSAVDATVAEMNECQRIIHRRVVALHGKEIRTQQESRSAWHRRPRPRRGVRLRKSLAVGAGDAERLPGGVGS